MTPMSAALREKATASGEAPLDFISPRKQISRREGSPASAHFARMAARVSGAGVHTAASVMRVFAGREGLAVCCADAMQEAQRIRPAIAIPLASRLRRRAAFFGLAQFSGINFYFSAPASARGAGVISMDQMDAGRMYMLSR